MTQELTSQLSASKQEFEQTRQTIKNINQLQKALQDNIAKETTTLLGVLLLGAVVLDCSDVHIEPEEEKVKIRVRIDGALHDLIFLPEAVYPSLLSRLKLLSGLKLNITSKAQDGRFSVGSKEEAIEVRTSTLPSEYGESVVMRLLNPKNLICLQDLGLAEDLLKTLRRAIKQPNGMIIITGPTGSGKTTTLYGVLKEIQQPEIKIITIEDPIEYHLEGISQSQVDPEKGYDFASGLQTIVRQDPDVILVGEIRDLETAKIALQAALTGHLVLTTLHTNDAAGTIARFLALGEKASNIAPALNLAVAQRLVRKICLQCAKKTTPTKEELDLITKELKSIKNVKIKPGLKIMKAKGCEACNNTGYKGRTGIYEFFLVDDEMENFIVKSPSIADLRAKAIEKGMTTMRQDGLLKVLEGVTTLEEIKKETGE